MVIKVLVSKYTAYSGNGTIVTSGTTNYEGIPNLYHNIIHYRFFTCVDEDLKRRYSEYGEKLEV